MREELRLRVEYWRMNHTSEGQESRLEERLREVEENFLRQIRERGFDPAQMELIAFPGPLAKLYAEREALRDDLEKLRADRLEQRDR